MHDSDTPKDDLRETRESIAKHRGIVSAHALPGSNTIEIDYDPNALTETDLRKIAETHAPWVSPDLRKYTFRLNGNACEACAIKLERRVKKIPGVRHATATYLGKILCLTFDEKQAEPAAVLEQVKATGAKVQPYEATYEKSLGIWHRIRSGQLNEEISCGIGLVFLIAAFVLKQPWLYVGAYLFNGQQGVRSALASLKEKALDIDVLMVLAALGAAIVGAPFEGALLLFLFSFSNVLQRYALERTQRAIHSLLKLRPDKAMVKRGNFTEIVRVETLGINDVVIVRPGEHIPIDGVIIEGSSNINESSITGESMPVSKAVGASLFAGTLNQSGALEIRVTKRAGDSTLARMVRLVEEAQAEKSGTQRFLEQAEQYYATGVILFTILVLLVPLLGWGEAFGTAFYRAMTIMVVASPCALVISTPATVLSAIGGAARRGILIKGGSHLEETSRIEIVALDKTGTLTVGKPSVTDFITAEGIHSVSAPLPKSAGELLAFAVALEAKSEHPLAAAVVEISRNLGLRKMTAVDFQSVTGKGAEATVEGTRYIIGSERMFREANAKGMERLKEFSISMEQRGRTCVWFGVKQGVDINAMAVIVLADTLRPEAKEMVAGLRRNGVKRVVMLTGDQQRVAEAIAEEAGIDEIRAELLPEDKVTVIRELKKQGCVLMVGDGVNDAPALAAANIGVAMGAAGTDIAMETADVVLMGDKLENIPLLLNVARDAKRILWQNLIFASGVIVVLMAAALGFALPLPIGVVGHEGSTVLVCLNGLRLIFVKQNAKQREAGRLSPP